MGSTNNILVIENDRGTLDLITETLEKLGGSVFTATDAELGITMSRETDFSLILVNLATPGANGLEICKKLQAQNETGKIPIFLLTMREGKFDPAYTKLYGIRGFLKKPLDPTSLLEAVQNYLQMGDYSEQNDYISTVGPSAPSFEEGPPRPEPEPEVALSEVEDEMALPDELKETLIQAGPGGVPLGESIPGTGIESPMAEGEPAISLPEESPFESIDEPSIGETETAPQSADFMDEEPEEDLFDGKLPGEDEDETDFEEFLTEETMRAGDHPGLTGKRSVKKTSRLSKKVFIPLILLPVLISIAVVSYIFILPKAPTPKKPVSIQAASPKPPEQAAPPTPMTPVKPEPTSPTPPPAPSPTPPPAPSASTPQEMTTQTEQKPASEKKVELPVVRKQSTGYYVQFGNFSSEQNANKMVARLNKLGLNTFISKGRLRNGTPSYRVLLDKEFKSLSKARDESRKIKKNKNVDSIPYSAFYVQFGNFTSEANANQLVKELKRKGLSSFVQISSTKSGAPSYRVLLDKPFGSLDMARSESRKIKKTHRVDSIPFSDVSK